MKKTKQKIYVNGESYLVNDEELQFLKEWFGYWEEKNGLIIFNLKPFIRVNEMAKMKGCSTSAIYKRSEVKNNGCTLIEKDGFKGVYFEDFMKYWF